jgi:predicted phage terminase large subunit-like protein
VASEARAQAILQGKADAAAKRRRHAERLGRLTNGSLYELVEELGGAKYKAPRHLAPLVDELENQIAPHEGQRLYWFSVPPGHFKTSTLQFAAVKHLLQHPDRSVAFLSHTAAYATKNSIAIRRLYVEATKPLETKRNHHQATDRQWKGRQNEWFTSGGGELVARGTGGDITGRHFRLIVIDDPVHNTQKAGSAIDRDRLWQWIEDDVMNRLDPDGCLVLVHTRFSDDDPIGRARDRAISGWRGQNIPALSGEEENIPLLPDVWSYDFLARKRRANPWSFASLFQGEPRPKGASLFGEPTYYTQLPKEFRPGYGIDLAYTEHTRADFSVLIKGHYEPSTRKLYIVDIKRSQVHAPQFADTLVETYKEQPGPMIWFCSGTEKGSAQFIRQRVPKLKPKVASTDKYNRATPAAEAWNEGLILVPDPASFPELEWIDTFVREITRFSGHKDVHDDQVDALAALFRCFQASKALLGMKALAAQGI